MRIKTAKISLLLALSLMAPLFSESDSERGEGLLLLGHSFLMKGDLVEARNHYDKAVPLLDNSRSPVAVLCSLRVTFKMGDYSSVLDRSEALINGGGSVEYRREGLRYYILALVYLDRDEGAYSLLKEYADSYRDPSWLLSMRDAYLLLGEEKEAERMSWILRRDYPLSPEALILKGAADRAVTPALLDSRLF